MEIGSFFRFDTFNPERAVTSYLYGPKILLATRVVGSIYTIAVLVGALITTESLSYFMKYFTHITYIALSIYYVWSMIWSILYVRLPSSERQFFIKQRNRGESNIYWVIIVVPLVYWSALKEDSKKRTGLYEWSSVSQHTTNGFLMLLELLSTRTLMEIRHIFFAILFLVLFLGMSWVAYWNEGGWVYPFMDFKRYNWTVVGLGYAGVVVGMVILTTA
ncbi:hypothetical protein BKA57DRAFT_502768 [Linnemannia elongata]|nr:hypothetical protein BKA57DRAFT_502768 [Linnemannia elongata]